MPASHVNQMSVVDEHGTLNLSARSLTNISLVSGLVKVECTRLSKLLVNNNSITKFPASILSHVRKLDCSDNNIAVEGCYSLSAFPNLEKLRIKENPITRQKDFLYLLLGILPKLRTVDGKNVCEIRLAVDSDLSRQVRGIWITYFRKLLGGKPNLNDFLAVAEEHASSKFGSPSFANDFKSARFREVAKTYFNEKVGGSNTAAATSAARRSSARSSPMPAASSSILTSPSSTRTVRIRLSRTVGSPTANLSTAASSPHCPPQDSSRKPKAPASSSTSIPATGLSAPGKGRPTSLRATSQASTSSVVDRMNIEYEEDEAESPVFDRPSPQQTLAMSRLAQEQVRSLAGDTASSSARSGNAYVRDGLLSLQRQGSALCSPTRSPRRSLLRTSRRQVASPPSSPSATGSKSQQAATGKQSKLDETLASLYSFTDDGVDDEMKGSVRRSRRSCSPSRAIKAGTKLSSPTNDMTDAEGDGGSQDRPTRSLLSPRRSRSRSPRHESLAATAGEKNLKRRQNLLSTSSPGPAPLAKRKRLAVDSMPSHGERKGVALDRRAGGGSGVEDRTEQQSVDGFDEDSRWMCTRLLRCHSENNSADDEDTSVWSSVFPESGGDIFASAGGDSVCVVNARSGQVLKKFKVANESFFCATWARTMVAGRKDEHLVAAAGSLGDVYILSTTFNVCFHVITSHTRTISSLIALPSNPDILAGSAGRFIQLHHLGNVNESKNLLQMTPRRICHLTAATDVHQLSSSPDGLSLMAATDDDIELWTFSLPWKKALADLNLKSDTSTQPPPKHRTISIYQSDVIVDTAAFLTSSLIVSRPAPCIGGLQLTQLTNTKKHPCVTLEYPNTTDSDMRINVFSNKGSSQIIVSSGHSSGSTHIYTVNGNAKLTTTNRPSQPSLVLQGPPSPVLTVALSRDFIVAGHSNNLLAIWQRMT